MAINIINGIPTIDTDREDALPMAEFIHKFHSPVAEVRISFTAGTGKIIMQEKQDSDTERLKHAVNQYNLCIRKRGDRPCI